MTLRQVPFVHLFRTGLGNYVYDVNTGTVLDTDADTYAYLLAQQRGDPASDCPPHVERAVARMKASGYLTGNRILGVRHPMEHLLQSCLARCIAGLSLQVTQSCNLRCQYCVYSGTGQYAQRSHTNTTMPLEIARKGIDFLNAHSRDHHTVFLGFYGGEPLLRFPFISQCVTYAKAGLRGRDIRFTLTTNGTLLNDRIGEYMVENQFSLVVSLDGPRELHDARRRYKASARGTFDTVMKNLDRLAERFPRYVEKQVSISMVLDANANFRCQSEFTTTLSQLGIARVRASAVSSRYSAIPSPEPSKDYIVNSRRERLKALLAHVGRLEQHSASTLSATLLVAGLNRTADALTPGRLPVQVHHAGPCVPGYTRRQRHVLPMRACKRDVVHHEDWHP